MARVHAAKAKGAGAAAIIDVVCALVVVFTLVVAMFTLLDGDIHVDLARAYVRQFHLTSEDDCPHGLGKPFWFACGSEVRRTNGPPILVSATK